MVKFTKTREWLIEEFVVKKRKIKDLATYLKCMDIKRKKKLFADIKPS